MMVDIERNLASGQLARDLGMALVLEGEEKWTIGTLIWIRKNVPMDWIGTGEELRVMAVNAGLRQPHHHNCWPSFIGGMIRGGYFEPMLRPPTHCEVPSSHARKIQWLRRIA
jgi:hypothetical protein